MGLFDSVCIPCPACGKEHEVRSKAGEPCLRRFNLNNAPDVVKAAIDGAEVTCECGHRFSVVTEVSSFVISLKP